MTDVRRGGNRHAPAADDANLGDHHHEHHHHHHGRSRVVLGPWILTLVFVATAGVRYLGGWLDGDDVRLWSTLFVSICIQALPFLVLGVVVSGLIAAFISPDFVQRRVPKRPILAVPSAGLAGMALPGCECGSVPIAGRLVAAGTPPAAAITFLLAAPAINPVVLVSTAVAFPNEPMLVVARFLASFLAAIAVGTWWARRGSENLLDALKDDHDHDESRLERFVDVASRDLVHAGGYLVLGALAAATLQLIVPRSVLDSVVSSEVLSVLVLALLAVVLSICSEADAFVAAGLPQFSLTSRLVFLVVGPVIDIKLVAMHAGVFGRGFALRFAPVTLIVAVSSAVIVGQVLL
ncbi:MAG: permease [Actinomycetota bacterium]